MGLFKRENLWFGVACFCAMITLIMGVYTIAVTSMCKDLTDVISMKDTYIKELEEQKERLASDAASCIEMENK